jgi:hypothetical protein
MPLAKTLGVCLLLLWPSANAVALVSAMAIAQSQQSQASNWSPQSSSAQAPDRSTSTSPQPVTGATAACSKNSQSGSTTKAGCNHAAGTKAKKQPGTPKPTAPPPGDTVPKTVVKNGSTDDSKVNKSPDPSPQARQQIDHTKELLDSSEANLKKVSARPLNESQQETVKQIESYMEQSKAAAEDDDVQRAYNLAVKANLLSAELAGH